MILVQYAPELSFLNQQLFVALHPLATEVYLQQSFPQLISHEGLGLTVHPQLTLIIDLLVHKLWFPSYLKQSPPPIPPPPAPPPDAADPPENPPNLGSHHPDCFQTQPAIAWQLS